jgi:tetrahydrodipicolinate N-succinyltransferase
MKEFRSIVKKVSYLGVEMMMNAMIQDGCMVDMELLV